MTCRNTRCRRYFKTTSEPRETRYSSRIVQEKEMEDRNEILYFEKKVRDGYSHERDYEVYVQLVELRRLLWQSNIEYIFYVSLEWRIMRNLIVDVLQHRSKNVAKFQVCWLTRKWLFKTIHNELAKMERNTNRNLSVTRVTKALDFRNTSYRIFICIFRIWVKELLFVVILFRNHIKCSSNLM
jgi:hypothetical protein